MGLRGAVDGGNGLPARSPARGIRRVGVAGTGTGSAWIRARGEAGGMRSGGVVQAQRRVRGRQDASQAERPAGSPMGGCEGPCARPAGGVAARAAALRRAIFTRRAVVAAAARGTMPP
jgi:hypothetical protein